VTIFDHLIVDPFANPFLISGVLGRGKAVVVVSTITHGGPIAGEISIGSGLILSIIQVGEAEHVTELVAEGTYAIYSAVLIVIVGLACELIAGSISAKGLAIVRPTVVGEVGFVRPDS
jgi:ABC-type Zn uptake system ZnuABC Zn-binding protein ZnuA